MKVRIICIITTLILLQIYLSGCSSIGLAKDSTFESNYTNEEYVPQNIYVSSARVIFKGLNPDIQTMSFYIAGTSELLELTYDGTTIINDRHSQAMSMIELQIGDVATIAYSSAYNKVGAIILDSDSFCYDNVSKYSIGDGGTTFKIGDDIYSVNNNTRIFSGGNEIPIEQLINHDVLTVQGFGNEILSIRVDDGHGYLELQNEDALLGGWIEIGQTVISKIKDNMLFTVPEGTYKVRLTNPGIEEYKEVTISRDAITTLDLGYIVTPEPDKGVVTFDIEPSNAFAKIDGNAVDYTFPIRLPLGIHEINISAEGYDTVTRFFEVTCENQNISYSLGVASGSDEEPVFDQETDAQVIVNSPVGVELYEDNIYVGITPVSYTKVPGTHTLTFRKSGYITTSYSIEIDNDNKDQTFAFSDLLQEADTASPTPTASVSATPASGNESPTPSKIEIITAMPTITAIGENASPTETMLTYVILYTGTPSVSPSSSASLSPSVVPTESPSSTVTPSTNPNNNSTSQNATISTVNNDEGELPILYDDPNIMDDYE